MGISNWIKFEHSLSFGEFSPFFDIKEELHFRAMCITQDVGAIPKEQIKSLCTKAFKELKDKVPNMVDLSESNEKFKNGVMIMVLRGIELASNDTEELLNVRDTLAGKYDVLIKMPRASTVRIGRMVVPSTGARFKIASKYDNYYGENTSIAFIGDRISFCLESKDSGSGIKGDRDMYIKVINDDTMYIDRISKYGL